MAMFRYTAKDRSGNSVSGNAEAFDEKAVTALLRKQNMIVLSIREDKKNAAGKKSKSLKRAKIKTAEIVLFSRQMATMIDAGIPLVQAIEILADQADSMSFRAILSDVKKDVTSGLAFNEALAKHPSAFTSLFVNMAKAGEASGALDDIMDRLATYMEKTESLVHKVKSAMNYPIVVSSMAVGITTLMLVKVVPVFKTMFTDFGAKLPLPTQILVNASDFLIKTFIFWVAAAVAVFFAIQRFASTEKGAFYFDGIKLKMPIFGVIIRKVAVAKFARTLATLMKSGVPILQALEIVGKTSGNLVIEKALEKVRASIREGENITDPLARQEVFPPLVVRMVSVGEQTGELEKMLNKIADFYDDQVNIAVSGLTSMIEPLVIAFMGVVVGGIVICMFLPIFQLATVVSK